MMQKLLMPGIRSATPAANHFWRTERAKPSLRKSMWMRAVRQGTQVRVNSQRGQQLLRRIHARRLSHPESSMTSCWPCWTQLPPQRFTWRKCCRP